MRFARSAVQAKGIASSSRATAVSHSRRSPRAVLRKAGSPASASAAVKTPRAARSNSCAPISSDPASASAITLKAIATTSVSTGGRGSEATRKT